MLISLDKFLWYRTKQKDSSIRTNGAVLCHERWMNKWTNEYEWMKMNEEVEWNETAETIFPENFDNEGSLRDQMTQLDVE